MPKILGIKLINYKEKYLEKTEMENPDSIRVYSPFFNLTKNTLYIFLPDYESKKYDKSLLNKEYTSLYFVYNDNNSIKLLKELNLDFNKIKKVTFEKGPGNIPKEDNNFIFQTLFSFNNIKNNLIFLEILFNFNDENLKSFFKIKNDYKVNSKLFEKINKMKALKYLHINFINFDKNIIIKLPNLKSLYCVQCPNLSLSGIICPNLEKLKLAYNNISNINVLKGKNFNKLKELNLRDNKISDISILQNVKFGDLSSNNKSNINILENINFKKLKILILSNNNISDINVLEKVKFRRFIFT